MTDSPPEDAAGAGRDEDRPGIQVHVQVETAYVDLVSEDWLQRVGGLALQKALAGVDRSDGQSDLEFSLVIAGDAVIHELNRTYRGVDATTDVLSFGDQESDFVSIPDSQLVYLGDVLISFPQAKRQAHSAGHPLEAELALLVTHGVLHLLGYDHATAEDKTEMWRRQAEILESLGLEGIDPGDSDEEV